MVSVEPPSEIITIKRNGRSHRVPNRLCLQVWYFNRAGRNYEVNKTLAAACKPVVPTDWDVEAAIPCDTSQGSRESFVPVEVNLLYKQSQTPSGPGTPDQALRASFCGALQATIDEFFREIGKQSHQATITPIGDSIDDNITKQYGYVEIKHSLAMTYAKTAYLVPRDEEKLSDRIRDVALQALLGASGGYDLYSGITGVLDLAKQGEEELAPAIQAVFKTFIEIKGQNMSPSSKESEDSDADLEMQETWNSLLSSTKCIQDLVRHMEECIEELKSGESIGNETLYDLTLKVAAIQCVLNLHQKNGDKLRELVASTHNQALLAGVLSAGGALYTGYRELRPPSLRKAIKYEAAATEFRKDLGHAHAAFAVQFCSQVLKVPPRLMSKVERKKVLCELGLDTTKMTNKEYTAELVAQRMEKVCKTFKKLEKLGQEVAKAVGVRENEVATSKSCGQSEECAG